MQKARNYLLLVFGALLGVSCAIFIYDNDAEVVIYFLSRQTDPLPLWLLVVIAALGGALLPRLFGLGAAWRRFWDQRTLKKRVGELEEEIVRLRNIPLEALPQQHERRETDEDDSAQRRPRPQLSAPRAHASASIDAGRSADPYESFLADGEGFDRVEGALYEGSRRPALLAAEDAEDIDPYALAFDAEDPAIADLDDKELFPAVIGRSSGKGKG